MSTGVELLLLFFFSSSSSLLLLWQHAESLEWDKLKIRPVIKVWNKKGAKNPEREGVSGNILEKG